MVYILGNNPAWICKGILSYLKRNLMFLLVLNILIFIPLKCSHVLKYKKQYFYQLRSPEVDVFFKERMWIAQLYVVL